MLESPYVHVEGEQRYCVAQPVLTLRPMFEAIAPRSRMEMTPSPSMFPSQCDGFEHRPQRERWLRRAVAILSFDLAVGRLRAS